MAQASINNAINAGKQHGYWLCGFFLRSTAITVIDSAPGRVRLRTIRQSVRKRNYTYPYREISRHTYMLVKTSDG